ncbi:UNVERIFIED_ORG: hypothetical protein J2R84_001789 [Bradyrhizobium japonicum]
MLPDAKYASPVNTASRWCFQSASFFKFRSAITEHTLFAH